MGITPQTIDQTLYDAFGQRQISTLYTQLNQYHVILETMPDFQTNPAKLQDIYVRSAVAPSALTTASTDVVTATTASGGSASTTSSPRATTNTAVSTGSAAPGAVSSINGAAVPLSTFTHFESRSAPLSVNHQGQFPVVTISFNLAPSASLGEATKAIEKAQKDIGMPLSVQTAFQGTAASFQASLSNEPILILAALVTVYIVLGVLYESYIHPITILSTLPSAGVGAILALADLRIRTERRRADRNHPADRHREEKRHHDDRLRARSGAQPRQKTRRMRFTRPACCASVRS